MFADRSDEGVCEWHIALSKTLCSMLLIAFGQDSVSWEEAFEQLEGNAVL